MLLSPTFYIEVNGLYPNDLNCAVARALEYIQNDKHERVVVGRGSVDTSASGGIGYAEALCLLPVGTQKPSRLRQELPSVRGMRPTFSISRQMVHLLHFLRTPPSAVQRPDDLLLILVHLRIQRLYRGGTYLNIRLPGLHTFLSTT